MAARSAAFFINQDLMILFERIERILDLLWGSIF
jgi:hypothetical protein